MTVSDGVQALRAAAELTTSCIPATCDVDGDGRISVSDGVSVLRKAAGLAVDERCSGSQGGALGESARLVLRNNPFGELTKTQSASLAASLSAKTAAVGSAVKFPPRPCPGGGFDETECNVGPGFQGKLDTVYDVVLDECASLPSDGLTRVEDGSQRFTVRDHQANCFLPGQNPRVVGRQIIEERMSLEIEVRDSNQSVLSRGTETDVVKDVTFGDGQCMVGGVLFLEEDVRDVSGRLDLQLFEGGEEVANVTQTFDHVAQTIELTPDCTPTYSRTAGSIRTVDNLTGETFTTSFGEDAQPLRYRMENETNIAVDGGLRSTCRPGEAALSYRTLEPLVYSTFGDCPRGGRVEVASGGAVVGVVRFTETGGVELTAAADGATTSFASCDSEPLLLRCE